MTAHQYGTLKHIIDKNIYVYREAKKLHMGTIGSLVKKGWVTHNSGLLTLTEVGLEEFHRYSHPHANFRKYEKDISDHVKNLLHVNKLLVMRNKAS